MPRDTRIGGLYVSFTADDAQFVAATARTARAMQRTGRATDALRRRLRGLNATLNSTVRSVASVRGGIALLAGAGALGALVNRLTEAPTKLRELQNRINEFTTGLPVTATQLGALTKALANDISGFQVENLSKVFRSLSRSVGEALLGVGEYADIFEELNINVRRFAQLRPDEQILALGRAYRQYVKAGGEAAVVASFAQQQLSREGQAIGALLLQVNALGQSRFEETLADVRRRFNIADDATLQRNKDLNQSFADFAFILQQDVARAVQAVAPEIERLLEILSVRLPQALRGGTRAAEAFADNIDGLLSVAVGVGLIKAVGRLRGGLATAFAGVYLVVQSAGVALRAALTAVTSIPAAVNAAGAEVVGTLGRLGAIVARAAVRVFLPILAAFKGGALLVQLHRELGFTGELVKQLFAIAGKLSLRYALEIVDSVLNILLRVITAGFDAVTAGANALVKKLPGVSEDVFPRLPRGFLAKFQSDLASTAPALSEFQNRINDAADESLLKLFGLGAAVADVPPPAGALDGIAALSEALEAATTRAEKLNDEVREVAKGLREANARSAGALADRISRVSARRSPEVGGINATESAVILDRALRERQAELDTITAALSSTGVALAAGRARLSEVVAMAAAHPEQPGLAAQRDAAVAAVARLESESKDLADTLAASQAEWRQNTDAAAAYAVAVDRLAPGLVRVRDAQQSAFRAVDDQVRQAERAAALGSLPAVERPAQAVRFSVDDQVTGIRQSLFDDAVAASSALAESEQALATARRDVLMSSADQIDAALILRDVVLEQVLNDQLRVQAAQDAQAAFEAGVPALERQGELAADYVRVLAEQQATQETIRNIANSTAQAFGRFVSSALSGVQSLTDAAKNLGLALIDALTQALLIAPIVKAIQAGLSPGGGIASLFGFASGGVGSGLAVVGERGPELVDLGARSRVYSNADSRRLVAGSGRREVVVHNSFNIQSTDGPGVRAALAQAAPLIVEQTRQSVLEDLQRPSSMRAATRG